MAEVDLTPIVELSRQNLEETRRLRREVGDLRSVAMLTSEYACRLDRRMDDFDRRMGELRDDLEMIFKSELTGRMAHLETTLEHRFTRIGDRLDALEQAPT